MTVKSARINGVVVDDNMLLRALEDLAAKHGRSVRDEHALVLSRVADRNSAAAWTSALAQVAIEQEAAPHAMVSEYLRDNPPDRLALTGTDDTRVELSAEDAAAEVTRLVQDDAARRRPVLDASKQPAPVPCRTIVLSRQERLYDDALALTGTLSTQAEIDRYAQKLSRGTYGRRALGDLVALAGPDRTDVLDVNDSVSDLDRETSVPRQSADFGSLSQHAADQLSGLAPVYQAVIKAALAAADADADPAAVDGYFAAAVSTAHAHGASVLAQELAERASQARLGQSALNGPDEAADQSAGETSAAAVRAEVDRLSSLNTVGDSGSRSYPPASLAARNAAERAARPGYSGVQNPIRV